MNNNELKKLLARVEKKYQQCWKILSSLKGGFDKTFISFQGILCEALIDLSKGYRTIHQTRQDLIKRKNSFSTKWFIQRQKTLSRRQKELINAIGIGRAMGDAFVWPFFMNNRELLQKHAKHQYSVHMPPGMGGIGEMMFIKNTFAFEGYLVLYHGITTILRIGDITLIDLKKFKVAGIGELKTTPFKNKLKIDILINLSDKKLPTEISKVKIYKKNETLNDFPPAMKERLKRQLTKINDTLHKKKKRKLNIHLDKILKFYYKELNTLLNKSKINKFTFSQLSNGLLCVVYKQKTRSLYSTVTKQSEKKYDTQLCELIPRTKKLLHKNSKFNRIQISPLLYTRDGLPYFMPGAKPIFWWNIDIELIQSIYFQKYLILTIFNPAHLLDEIKNQGYSIIEKSGKKLDFKLELKNQKVSMEYHNFSFYIDLITQSLIKESGIVDFIKYSLDKTRDVADKQKVTKVEFMIHQML